MFKMRVLGIVLCSGLLFCGSASPQKKPSPTAQDRQREQHSLAFNVVAAINAAEANSKKKTGAYTTWETLYNTGEFTSNGTKWAPESMPTVRNAMFSSGPEIVPGWKLRLTISKDGKAYSLLLEDVNDPKCHYAIVSDDSGIIRQSRSIECPLQG
jgi:hypothetical protein